MAALKTVSIIGAVAVIYAAVGLLSSFLVIPPGLSSPVWPAAGLALIAATYYAKKAALGVIVGAFLINLSTQQLSLFSPSTDWFPAFFMAIGAGLQAYVGARLVRRSAVFQGSNKAASPQVLNIALLAGPLSCFISASIATATLFCYQFISSENLLHVWAIWWIGDSIGVIISVPVLVAINVKKHWGRQQLMRFSLPYFTLLILAVAFFYSARDADNERINHLFSERSHSFYQAIERHLGTLTEHEMMLAESFLTFDDYSEQRFSRIAKKLLQITPGVQAMSWVRYVPASERQAVDALLQARGALGITERINTELSRALSRSNYFSVFYIEPLQGNEKALGFDIGSNSKRRIAIERAISEKMITVTEPILLVQEVQKDAKAFLLLAPVITDTGKLLGLISGVYRANDIFNAALSNLEIDHINTTVTDISDSTNHLHLYGNEEKSEEVISWSKELHFSGRTWLIKFTPSTAYLHAERGWAVWGVLIGGFLLVSIFGAFFLILMNQNLHIESEVKEKTLALNTALKSSEKASKAKSQFLANMSHELRTPLNSIIGFTQRVKNKYGEQFNTQVNESLDTVLRNGQHLLSLITEVLDISKIEAGKMEIACEVTATAPLLQEAVNTMASSAKEKSLSLVLLNNPETSLNIDKKRFMQIILNLLSNAVKFTDQGSISVDCYKTCTKGLNAVEIKITDTGRGIPEHLLPKLFKPFEQLQDEDISTPGTGLGLVLSKKMMELHGGYITVKSQVNKGTTFTLWFPSSPRG